MDNKKKKVNPAKFFWIVIACIVLYVLLDVIAQILPPHYNPVSQAESDLAVGSFGFIMTINFLNRGFYSLLFIFAFLQTLDVIGVARSKYRSGTYLLGIWGVGALLLAIFPTDVPATPVSWHGAIHLVVAVVAFLAGAFGTFVISRNLGHSRQLNRLGRISLPISALTLIC